MDSILSESFIRENFLGLSFSRQLKLLDLYLIDLEGTVFYDYFNSVFSKYVSIISKFSSFKENFSKFDHEGRNDLRSIISNRRKRVSPIDEICADNSKYFLDCDLVLSNSLYCPEIVDDEFVDIYIYNSFSYNKDKRIKNAIDFVNYYSSIENMKFKQLLGLCNGNCDSFNREIKALSKDFYSLYLSMGTIQRMTYIWYLSHLKPFVIDDECDDIFSNDSEYKDTSFSGDAQYVNPVAVNTEKIFEEKPILNNYFKRD